MLFCFTTLPFPEEVLECRRFTSQLESWDYNTEVQDGSTDCKTDLYWGPPTIRASGSEKVEDHRILDRFTKSCFSKNKKESVGFEGFPRDLTASSTSFTLRLVSAHREDGRCLWSSSSRNLVGLNEPSRWWKGHFVSRLDLYGVLRFVCPRPIPPTWNYSSPQSSDQLSFVVLRARDLQSPRGLSTVKSVGSKGHL